MRRWKHLDSLLLFFVFSIALLQSIRTYWPIDEWDRSTFRTEDQLNSQFKLKLSDNGIEEIDVYNDELFLEYSLDGGDHYSKAPGRIRLSDFKMHDLLSISTSHRWLPNNRNFPEIKSVRVRIVDLKSKPRKTMSPVKVCTWFPEKMNLPVVSINTSQKGMFGWKEGIHVLGSKSTEQKSYLKEWWYKSANFHQRGTEWEREANIQFFDNGKPEVNEKVGIRISGNATRGFSQKSIRVNVRKTYGKKEIRYPFWKYGIDEVRSFVLRTSGNDNTHTMFADLLIHRICRNSEVLVQEGFPVYIFINGNYWGIFNFRERIDKNFIAEKKDWKRKDVNILENQYGKLKKGKKKEKKRFDDLIDKIKGKDQLSSKDYEFIDSEINLKSFTDYIVFETFFANQDWPNNNSMWYCRDGKKWKWILNDLDYSMAYPGMHNVNSNLFEKLKKKDSYMGILFSKLLTVDKFKNQFTTRGKELLSTTLSSKQTLKQFDELYEIYRLRIPSQIERWRSIDSFEEWEDHCQNNKKFLEDRGRIYREQLDKL